MLIRGLSAFPITPADGSGRVDVGALSALLTRLTAAGVDSIGLLGTTGSFAYLSRQERRRAVEAAAAVVGDTLLLAGIGALRTDEAVALAQDAKLAGARAGLLAPVSYTPLRDDEVFAHVAAVAEHSGLPVIIYNNPGTTHFTFSAELTARLSRVEGVIAVKNPAPTADAVAAHLAELRATTPPTFSLGYSGDARATETLIAGADAWYSVLAGLLPAPCLEIVRAASKGDAAAARRGHERLRPLFDLIGRHGGVRVMHAAAEALGLCRHQPQRPLLPLPESARQELRAALDGVPTA